jgi:peptidoglycan/xylan/chitin deacetylase (PgdA/CDA1 family)
MFTTAMFHFIRKNNHNYKINFFSEHSFSLLMNEKIKKNTVDPKKLFDKKKIDKNSYLLTFDDGYKDYYSIFKKYLNNEKAIFFLNGKTIEDKDYLDVNKIQLIANNFNKKELMYLTEQLLNKKLKKKFLLKNLPKKSQNYRPFDSKEISMFKYIFQIFLPLKVSSDLLNEIFYDYLKIDHKKVFKDLYLNIDQIHEMKKKGMIFGNHTFNHYPLIRLNYKGQFYEIKKNHDFLVKYDLLDYNIFAYPYGMYNKVTLNVLKKLNYNFAFTVKKNKSSLINPLEINRKDANYL